MQKQRSQNSAHIDDEQDEYPLKQEVQTILQELEEESDDISDEEMEEIVEDLAPMYFTMAEKFNDQSHLFGGQFLRRLQSEIEAHGWGHIQLDINQTAKDTHIKGARVQDILDAMEELMPKELITLLYICTLAQYQEQAAVPLLIAILNNAGDTNVDNIYVLDAIIDIVKIALICCLRPDNPPIKELTDLAVTGGKHSLMSVRVAAMDVMRLLHSHKKFEKANAAQFCTAVIQNLLKIRENALTAEDEEVITHTLLGIGCDNPLVADAIFCKYRTKLTPKIRTTLETWQKCHLEGCDASVNRDYDNTLGMLNLGIACLVHWADEECDHPHHATSSALHNAARHSSQTEPQD